MRSRASFHLKTSVLRKGSSIRNAASAEFNSTTVSCYFANGFLPPAHASGTRASPELCDERAARAFLAEVHVETRLEGEIACDGELEERYRFAPGERRGEDEVAQSAGGFLDFTGRRLLFFARNETVVADLVEVRSDRIAVERISPRLTLLSASPRTLAWSSYSSSKLAS
jgi:hypothetical protein